MNKFDTSNYEQLICNIKDDRELINLLIRHLCSKGAIDFREWFLYLEAYEKSKQSKTKQNNVFFPQKKAA